jgi:hypothetical protein
LTVNALDDLQPAMRSPGKALAIAALVVAAAFGMVWILRPPSRPVTAARQLDPTPPPATVPLATLPPPKPSAPPAGNVQIDIVDAPPGVQVFVDDIVDDFPVRLPRGEGVHVLRFEAPGYVSREWKVNGRRDRTIAIHLHRRKGSGTAIADPASAASPSAWPDPFTQGPYASERKQPRPVPAPPPATSAPKAASSQPAARGETANKKLVNPFDP